MLLLKSLDLFPGGEAFREGPAIDSKADTMKDGDAGILQVPESGGKRVWGTKRSRGGSHHRGDRRRRRLYDIGRRGKISSWEEQRMGGRII